MMNKSGPRIDGYLPLRALGSGGTANVFLYRQETTGRDVAVKVMHDVLSDAEAVRRFETDSAVIMQLSQHPAMVTIHAAGICTTGQPYVVMEYCAEPNLARRYRALPLEVGQALEIGVRLAGAAESLHRAGLVHRDIKPANVLMSDEGLPLLTDFQISTARLNHTDPDMIGLSIPWSPPEYFAHGLDFGVLGDVYGLAATVYTLIAGRSPFERGGDLDAAIDLMRRIETEPVPRIQRLGGLDPLYDVLARGLAKDPFQRYPSADEFAQAIGHAQDLFGAGRTPLQVLELPSVPEPHTSAEPKNRVAG